MLAHVASLFSQLPCVGNGKVDQGVAPQLFDSNGAVPRDAAGESSGTVQLKTKVSFRWYLPGLKGHEEVRVIGDCPELGQWDAALGVSLKSKDSCCWRSRGVALPLLRPIQYEYVVVDQTTGIRSRPDDAPTRRNAVPTGLHLVLEDDDGEFRNRDTQGEYALEVESPVSPGVSFKRMVSMESVAKSKTDSSEVEKAQLFGSGKEAQKKFDESLLKEKELQLTEQDTVVAVFHKLPWLVERTEGGGWRAVEKTKTKKTPFTVHSLLRQSKVDDGRHKFQIKFVGQPGVYVDDPSDRQQIRDLLAPHNCVPVFLDKTAAETHMEVCHRYLWPVFHNMKVFYSSADQKFDEAKWKVFKDVNKAYAEAVESALVANSLVWVHDYHLILVPRYLFLRESHLAMTLGFFLHCGFPSSEVLRCVPVRVELLQSMLSCNSVTFQIFEYARHFLSCSQIILQTTYSFQEGGVLQVEHDNRSIVVRADHVVLPWKSLVERLDDPYVQSRAASIRAEFGDRTIFGSLDGNEPFAGMALKLRAFRQLVADCPQHRRNIALVQHIIEMQGVTAAYETGAELIEILRKMAEEINSKFGVPGDPPLISIKTADYEADDRLAVLLATDVLLDTSINDGLNLQPFMFYCAHSKDRKGIVIASEFTGCTSVLTGALKINPWNTKAVMDAMHHAITMDGGDQQAMFTKDHSYVSTQTFEVWVDNNLSDLKAARRGVKAISMAAGFEKRLMESGFRALNNESVVRDYRQSKARLIFLDFEGTLSPDRRTRLRYGENSGLENLLQDVKQDVVEVLRQLASDQKNIVYVISGRDREGLDSVFSGIKDLGLCAEHGFYWTLPGKLNAVAQDKQTRWHPVNRNEDAEDVDWISVVVELFKQYTKRLQGSIIERKGSAVTWSYHEVGAPELARVMAHELSRLLDPKEPDGLLKGYPVKVVWGKGYVEVKRLDVDKGLAVKRVLDDLKNELGIVVDFILCCGDDRSDEDMFEVIKELENTDPGMEAITPKKKLSKPGRMSAPLSWTAEDDFRAGGQHYYYYSATIGRKSSKAKFFIKDTDAVVELLTKLAKEGVRTKFSQCLSVPDMMALVAEAEDDDDSQAQMPASKTTPMESIAE
jgi:trehalose 6-phosphate synthase/phosphatase